MNRKMKWGVGGAVGLLVILIAIFFIVKKNGSEQKLIEQMPIRGDIELTVSTVGTVKPQNRLEIKPPVNGRIESILVKEGQEVKVGEIMVLMSSTERATLMDAARLKGAQEFRYWQKAYKETPLVAPIDGVIIVRDVEPGQSVTTGDAVLVLSNRLIVEADMDETDIGAVKNGQKALIGLDAYPEIEIDAVVDHISYESEVVNNVTIYKVDILPTEVPDIFRSGMSANVEVIIKEVKDALLIPSSAIIREGKEQWVLAKNPSNGHVEKIPVKVGLENNGYVEIQSGISDTDTIMVQKDSYTVPKKSNGTNPFLPSFRGKSDKEKK